MKAPDKMHIGYCDPSLERGFATSSVEKMKSDDIEYIRKDLLLEWLVQRNKEINGETMALWRSLEIRELYDKINSL